MPIATGERLTTKYEFARVLETGAASILQMNLGRVGGILEAKKIAAMAEAHYAQIAPHLYCGPVVGAANIQLAACSPNFLILESIERWDGFHAEILKKPIRWEDGFVIPRTSRAWASSSTRRSRSPILGRGPRSISCRASGRCCRRVSGCLTPSLRPPGPSPGEAIQRTCGVNVIARSGATKQPGSWGAGTLLTRT